MGGRGRQSLPKLPVLYILKVPNNIQKSNHLHTTSTKSVVSCWILYLYCNKESQQCVPGCPGGRQIMLMVERRENKIRPLFTFTFMKHVPKLKHFQICCPIKPHNQLMYLPRSIPLYFSVEEMKAHKK